MGCTFCKARDDSLDDSGGVNRPLAKEQEQEQEQYQAKHLPTNAVEEKTVNDNDSSSVHDDDDSQGRDALIDDELSPIVGSERYSSLREEPASPSSPLSTTQPAAAAVAAVPKEEEDEEKEAVPLVVAEKDDEKAPVVVEAASAAASASAPAPTPAPTPTPAPAAAAAPASTAAPAPAPAPALVEEAMADAPKPSVIRHTDSMVSSATSVDTSFDASDVDDDDDDDVAQQPLRRVETQSMMHQELLAVLEDGSVMVKHGGRGKPQQRVVFLHGDGVYWNEPSKKVAKKSKCIHVANITDVIKGKSSKRFQRGKSSSGDVYPADQCFTIVSKKKELNLTANTVAECNVWIEALGYARKKVALMAAFASSSDM